MNPFTGNPIVDSSQVEGEHYVIVSQKWDINENNGNQYIASEWATVKGDIAVKKNWTFYTDLTTLPPDLED